MRCPSCQFENRDGAKFCRECGHKFEVVCSKCGTTNPVDSRFCDECGGQLEAATAPVPKELSFDEKIEKLQRYLPKGLTEKILSQKDKIEGERKQVTVMFCDMAGFTTLTERLGPEDAYVVMDQVYEILIHKVHDYEGTVNEMTGDGIMALFGAPIALEDAPQRTIRSAYAIHREMTRFSEKIKQERGIPAPIKMRIGIHTGPVVVGTLGNDLRVEFKAVGDTVNLAARMEDLAEPGTTYVTGDTFKLTEGLFRFEALGDKTVKGRQTPVPVYQVIAPSGRQTRFDVNAERGLTPFLGRQRELDLMLDAFERAKTGRGQALSIVAEAGLGKSRLLYEFRKAVAHEDFTFMEGRCLSYGRGIAYHPIIDMLKSGFRIQEDDPDLEIREKVERGLSQADISDRHTLPLLLELLSVKDSGIDRIQMSPEGKKDHIMTALNRIVIRSAQDRPLILAIEDLHWADKSSEESLKYLLESLAGKQILLIFTYRPEFVHSWGHKSYHSQINLNRLANRESLAMASFLLATEDIRSDLADLILAKTEGVPFFIEEFVKSLKDLKLIRVCDHTCYLAQQAETVTIPSTIQDVIMARVDSLPDETKRVLQVASVIGREFNFTLLQRSSGFPEQDLLSQLSICKESELLYERGIYPQATYIYKHALTQEVVYDSILARRKKDLHRDIGSAIENLYQKNIDEYDVVLAEHFSNSENFEKAAKYYRLAGRKSEKAGAIHQAIAYGYKQVACIEKLPKSEPSEKSLIDARTKLGLYHAQMAQNLQAKSLIDPIAESAIAKNYKKNVGHIYYILGQYEAQVEEDYAKASEDWQKALSIGEDIGDPLILVLANTMIGLYSDTTCGFEKPFHHLETALKMNMDANSLWGISVIKSEIAYFHFFQGNMIRAHEIGKEALRVADESGDIFSKGLAHTFYGMACYGKGYLKESKEHLQKGVQFTERINNLLVAATANHWFANACFTMTEYRAAEQHLLRAITILRENKLAPSLANMYELDLARVKGQTGECLDLEVLSTLVEGAKKVRRFFASFADTCMCEILLNMDERLTPEAEVWIKKAIETDKRNGTKWLLAGNYALYGDLLKRKNDLPQAREKLVAAIEIFKQCGADGWVEKYEKELATL